MRLGLTGCISHQTELDQLFAQVTRPRLRSILTESYRDVSYFLDEDSYAEAEYKDLVRRRFIKGWEHVLSAFKVSLFPVPSRSTWCRPRLT